MVGFWDLNSLTVKDLEEIQHLQKALSIDAEEAMFRWMEEKENKGKIQKVGYIKDGEIKVDKITKDGVKELKGKEALDHMLKKVKKDKL